jgi:uncharacterized protein YcbK (DUF882 family)
MQFHCQHCGALIRMCDDGKVGCPNGCENPFPPSWSDPEEQLSPHFKRKELACHCCGKLVLDERLLPALERLRSLADAPIHVIDAYRCPKHNAGAQGVPKSAHLDGRAADIRIRRKPPEQERDSPWMSLQQMYDSVIEVPEFRDGGIGIYSEGTMHVDVRGQSARWARVNGVYMGIPQSKLLERYP